MTQARQSTIPYICVMPDAAPDDDFAALIRDGRTRKGWSQEDLEAESGVSRSTLSRWERGISTQPEPSHVRSVCAALGIDPRRAAIALGYLTPEEVNPPGPGTLSEEAEEILRLLPDIPAEQRAHWIQYLKWLQQSHNQQKRGERAS